MNNLVKGHIGKAHDKIDEFTKKFHAFSGNSLYRRSNAIESRRNILCDNRNNLGFSNHVDKILNCDDGPNNNVGYDLNCSSKYIVGVYKIRKCGEHVAKSGSYVQNTQIKVIQNRLNNLKCGRQTSPDKICNNAKNREQTLECSCQFFRSFVRYNERFCEMVKSLKNIIHRTRIDRENVMPRLRNSLKRLDDGVEKVPDRV